MIATTVRMPEELHSKIAVLASESDMGANAFIVAILEAAVRRGWRVEKRPAAEVVEPR